MYLLLLLAFALSLLAPSLLAPTEPGAPPHPTMAFLGLAGVLAALALWNWTSSRLIARWAADDPPQAARRQGRIMRINGLIALGCYAAFLYYARWATLIDESIYPPGPHRLNLIVRLIALAPFLAIMLVHWWGSFRATVALRHLAATAADQAAALPVPGAPPAPADITFGNYLVFNIRQYLLVLLAPLVFVLTCGDAVRLLCHDPDIEFLAHAAAVLVLYVFSPMLLRLVWQTEALPAGPLRERLTAMNRRGRTRVRNIILWHTQGLMVNACMTGLMWPLRYVFLSDSLIDSLHPAQVEAVYGHELGHGRYFHILFFMVMVAAWFLLLGVLGLFLPPQPEWEWLAWAATVLFAAAYWGGFFGYVSRRFEQQCDIHGALMVTCPGEHDPIACEVHKPGRPIDPNMVCPFQAWAFGSALHQIALLNGTPLARRGWRHFGVGHRLDYLQTIVGRPDVVRRLNHRLRLFRILFLAGTVLLGLAFILLCLWLQQSPF